MVAGKILQKGLNFNFEKFLIVDALGSLKVESESSFLSESFELLNPKAFPYW